MFQIGFGELLLVAILGFVVLGPRRLPEAAALLGKAFAYVRKLSREMMTEAHNLEIKLNNPAESSDESEQKQTTPKIEHE